ncbi:MAG: TIGR00282 family metallophosphoesterase [Candidatus Izemoplasmatales bacterium]
MRILFVGDVYMAPGRKAFAKYYETVKNEYKPQFVVVNGENIADGNGITADIYRDLMSAGVNVVTLGNHAFTRRDSAEVLKLPNIVRPANYGRSAAGREYLTVDFNGKKVTVVNLLGRVFMRDQIDNPFVRIDEILSSVKSDYWIVDFHAEATSEKIAMSLYLDGRVDALIGTHTHVPTADAGRLPKGTLYVTDVGMTGVRYGVIGGQAVQGIRKFLSGVPETVVPELNGPLQFNAVFLDLQQKRIESVRIAE